MEDYKKFVEEKKHEKSITNKIFSNINRGVIVAIVVMFALIIMVTDNGTKNGWVWTVFAIAIVIYFLSLFFQPQNRELIPRHILLERIREDISKEIGPGKCFATGTTFITYLDCKDEASDSGEGFKVHKYNFSVKLKEPNKPSINFIAQIDPYTARIRGYIETPCKWTGKEEISDLKDIQYIFPVTFSKEEKK